jgi:hypothetical protein
MNTEIIFFCGLDCEKYYMRIERITNDNKITFLFDNSDCEGGEYVNLNNVYKKMFNKLKYLISDYFENEHNLNLSFFDKSFIIQKKFISNELIERALKHNLIIVQFKFKYHVIYELFYAITTEEIYNEYKKKFKLVIVNMK